MQNRPLEQLERGDVEALFGVVCESRHLEFKSTLPGKGDDEKGEFLKDVSALANTDGGDILYGVAEDKETRTASNFVPIDTSFLDAEFVRLNQVLNTGVRPRIPMVRMQAIAVNSKESVVIVRVSPSHIGPHQVTFRQSYKFHGRNTNGTYTLEVDELRDKILRQAALAQQMHDFRRSRVELIRHHPEDMPSPIDSERKLVVHYLPEESFARPGSTNASLIAEARYRNAILAGGAPTHTMLGLSYRPNIDGYVIMNGRSDDALQYYVQIFNDGGLEFTDGAVFRTSTDEAVIYHETLEDTLFRQYEFARGIFSTLGITGRVAIYATALGVRDATIKPQANTRSLDFVGHSTAINRDPAFFNALLVETMETTEPQRALRPLIEQIWRACAYSHAYSYKGDTYVGRRW